MSYELIEISEQSGSPRLLFIFTFGDTVWRFTTSIEPIIFGGNTYTHAQISPSEVVTSTEIARDNLTLNMPIVQEPGPTVLTDFENVLGVTILRGHTSDPDNEFISFWKGRAVNFQIDNQTLKIHCEPVFTSLRRPGLNAKYQRSCRWSLYGRGCWVDMEDYAFYTSIKGGGIPPVIIPPENALIYVKGVQGIEVWNMDTIPFSTSSLIGEFPGTEAVQVAYSLAANRLFIASNTQIYRWRTDTKPYTPLEPIPAPVIPAVMALSPNATRLFFGNTAAGQNYFINLENDEVFNIGVDSLNEATFSPSGQYFVYTRSNVGSGNGFKVYDVTSWPPVQITGYTAEASIGYGNVAIRTGNIMAMNMNSLSDLYIYNLATKALLRVFSTNINIKDMIFTPDGTRWILLLDTGLRVYDTTNPDPNTWNTTLLINSGLPTNNAPLYRKILSVSADSRYFALWQNNVAGDQRIVFDLTQNPIERVTSFDNLPAGATFLSTQIVGDFI